MQWRSWLPCHPWNSRRRSTIWRFRCFTNVAHRPICSSCSGDGLFFIKTTQTQIKTSRFYLKTYEELKIDGIFTKEMFFWNRTDCADISSRSVSRSFISCSMWFVFSRKMSCKYWIFKISNWTRLHFILHFIHSEIRFLRIEKSSFVQFLI